MRRARFFPDDCVEFTFFITNRNAGRTKFHTNRDTGP